MHDPTKVAITDPCSSAAAMRSTCSPLRQLPLLLQLGPDLEQTGGMLLVVCDCISDGTAQHVKGIIFGVVDLQDPEGFGDVVVDKFRVGGGLSFFNALGDHRQR